jgi:hypothetical protein
MNSLIGNPRCPGGDVDEVGVPGEDLVEQQALDLRIGVSTSVD